MKKSINIKGNNKDVYDYAKNAGFDGCDISLADVKMMSASDWEDKIYEIKNFLDERELECIQIHMPVYDIFLSSEIILEEEKRAILNSIKAMKILGCKWGAYHPRASFSTKFNSEAAMKDNFKELSIYLEEAEKYDVGIAVENIPVFPDCPQHRFFSSDYDEFNDFIDSFKSDKMKICWDFGHANLMPIKQEKAFKILGDKIRIVHMHNNFRFNDDHIMPTLGTIDWENVMPAFNKCGYNGAFSLEVNYFDMTTELKSYFAHGYDALCMLEKKFIGE